MAPRQRLPVEIKNGQWSGGDAALIPDGYVRKMRNMVWEDAWLSRAPLTYDGLTNVRGLGLWHDVTNDAVRLIATDLNAGVYKMYVKGAAGETWSADISSSSAQFGTIIDSVSYRGKWLAASPSAVGGTTPLRVFYYDGTTYDRDGNLPSSFRPYCLAVFRDRVFYGGPLIVGQNFTSDVTVYAYDTSGWTLTNVTSSTISANGTTLRRIVPTNTTTASAQITVPTTVAEFFGNGAVSTVQFHCELRGTDQTYAVPVTLQVKYASARQNNYAYTAGQVVVPAAPNGYRYRAKTTGTSAAGPPVYPTTVGGEVVDGGVTWINDGSDVAASQKARILGLSTFNGWTITRVIATIPNGAKTDVAVAIQFGTTDTPTYTLAPLDFSFMDGLSVSNPLKQNHGQQVKSDAFEHPFFSNEAVLNFTIDKQDTFYWSEVFEPLDVRAQNSFALTETTGRVTAIRAVGDYLVVAKRNARWVFASSEDANYVVLPVGGVRRGAGILNPKAADISDHDGMLYYVGENGVYRWGISDEPQELCGEAMLREMFDKSTATWCESQAAPSNRALLTIDQKNKAVLVYVQKGVIHRYDIRGKAWSTIEAGGYQICDMLYNPGTGHVYVAFSEAASGTAGLARLDATQAAAEDQISSSGTLPVTHEVIFRPIEGRPRVDMAIDELFVNCDATVANQVATAYYSKDQGSTFTASSTPRNLNTATANYEPERFGIWQSWGTITPRLTVVGKAGTGAFKLSGVEVAVRAQKKPEYPKKSP